MDQDTHGEGRSNFLARWNKDFAELQAELPADRIRSYFDNLAESFETPTQFEGSEPNRWAAERDDHGNCFRVRLTNKPTLPVRRNFAEIEEKARVKVIDEITMAARQQRISEAAAKMLGGDQIGPAERTWRVLQCFAYVIPLDKQRPNESEAYAWYRLLVAIDTFRYYSALEGDVTAAQGALVEIGWQQAIIQMKRTASPLAQKRLKASKKQSDARRNGSRHGWRQAMIDALKAARNDDLSSMTAQEITDLGKTLTLQPFAGKPGALSIDVVRDWRKADLLPKGSSRNRQGSMPRKKNLNLD